MKFVFCCTRYILCEATYDPLLVANKHKYGTHQTSWSRLLDVEKSIRTLRLSYIDTKLRSHNIAFWGKRVHSGRPQERTAFIQQKFMIDL